MAQLLWLWSPLLFAFAPFFDENPATLHAPAPPRVGEFDRQVLALCGGWGDPVQASDFERLLLEPANAAVLDRLRAALDGAVYGRPTGREQFVRELRRLWFEQRGFRHVFCGEPGKDGRLGGLHYAPRYLQAQQRGWAGYRPLAEPPDSRAERGCRNPRHHEALEPPVYSVGVRFLRPGKEREGFKCLSGYHREMDAEALLIAGTQAFKAVRSDSNGDTTRTCFFEVRLPGIAPYTARVVIRRDALRTFYPVARKAVRCDGKKESNGKCRCVSQQK